MITSLLYSFLIKLYLGLLVENSITPSAIIKWKRDINRFVDFLCEELDLNPTSQSFQNLDHVKSQLKQWSRLSINKYLLKVRQGLLPRQENSQLPTMDAILDLETCHSRSIQLLTKDGGPNQVDVVKVNALVGSLFTYKHAQRPSVLSRMTVAEYERIQFVNGRYILTIFNHKTGHREPAIISLSPDDYAILKTYYNWRAKFNVNHGFFMVNREGKPVSQLCTMLWKMRQLWSKPKITATVVRKIYETNCKVFTNIDMLFVFLYIFKIAKQGSSANPTEKSYQFFFLISHIPLQDEGLFMPFPLYSICSHSHPSCSCTFPYLIFPSEFRPRLLSLSLQWNPFNYCLCPVMSCPLHLQNCYASKILQNTKSFTANLILCIRTSQVCDMQLPTPNPTRLPRRSFNSTIYIYISYQLFGSSKIFPIFRIGVISSGDFFTFLIFFYLSLSKLTTNLTFAYPTLIALSNHAFRIFVPHTLSPTGPK
jgi:hypothetical protein